MGQFANSAAQLEEEVTDHTVEIADLQSALGELEARVAKLESGAEPIPPEPPDPGPVTWIAMGNDETVTIAGLKARSQCDDSPKNSLFKSSDGTRFKFAVEGGDDWYGTERSELIWPRFASGAFTLTAVITFTKVPKSSWLLFTQGHQSSNEGNPPCSVKVQNGKVRCDIAPPITEVGDRDYPIVIGTHRLHFAMQTPHTGVNGRFFVKFDDDVLADYTGNNFGLKGDSVDPKCGIYRSDTNEVIELEFADIVVRDGFFLPAAVV